MSSHRRSVVSKTDTKGGAYNYQKEVKQLKKDIRLRNDKILLLNKDIKHKQDTIDLLNTGITTKDQQLQLKDKELIPLEQNLKLLTEKSDILEKNNEELRNELNKQNKLTNIAEKKQSIAQENNVKLLQQINSLIHNLNNLKNVNIALSSQLSMTMNAAQNMHSLQQQSSVNNSINMNIMNITSNNEEQNEEDNDKEENEEDNNKSEDVIPMIIESKTSDNDDDDGEDDEDEEEKEENEVLKDKKRKKDKRKERRRSEGFSNDRKKDKKKDRRRSDANQFKEVGVGDDYDFGNAPKKKKPSVVSFDTYLEGLESENLRITRGGRLINMDYFSDSLYIISSNGFSSGKHEWEIKALQTGDLADEIGVCSDWDDLEVNGNGIADMGSDQLGARAVYANDPSTGVAFHDAYDEHNKLTYDKKYKKKECIWGNGDIIKVSINLNKWSVKFYLNNKQIGKSIAITKDLTYYPILCAYGNCSYQVISCL